MLKISPKGTVPVLQLGNGIVLEESWAIMKWAVSTHDPENLFPEINQVRQEIESLVGLNDFEFKHNLDKYKYSDRYPQYPQLTYRVQCEKFLNKLDQRLRRSTFLLGKKITLGDIAIFPFVRQFSMVEAGWLAQSNYKALSKWLEQLLDSDRFRRIMDKKPVWQF